ncbi:VWA-like domain-containing protein [uncultured Rhodoblastus sp.]|uniref:vWA domain-containing protein n=1 Tax=uncultured Rhodoblastus sp. TaxID=543037 RepID=UPI0025F72C38|nr:VWA-like domain-containing protein [uncultured Rhodoblastus sp.]
MLETPAHGDHRGTRAIQRMVEFAPSTGGLALWVRHRDIADRDAPAVMTDGEAVYYGPAFDGLGLLEQTGLVAHEVLHIALRHPQRALDLRRLLGDVDLRLFNICADAIVNSTLAHLGWLRLPPSCVFLEQVLAQALELQQDAETALLQWDVERLYRSIDDRRIKDDARQGDGRSGASGARSSESASEGRDSLQPQGDPIPSRAREDGPRAARVRELGADSRSDLAPSPEAESSPEAETEQAREWSERLLRGHAGDGEFSMLRALIADLPRTRTPWRQVLRTRLARGLSRKQAVSWSRPTRSYIANQGRAGPNRRLPWEPGYGANATAPKIAVMVDVSGSIDDALMQRFADEIAAISRRQEAGLILVIGDDRVRRVEVFKPGRFDLGNLDFTGGGGTDFTPLLERADQYRPDIGVVLTDLEGPAWFRPNWPVIWAVPESHASTVPPFGQLLTLAYD